MYQGPPKGNSGPEAVNVATKERKINQIEGEPKFVVLKLKDMEMPKKFIGAHPLSKVMKFVNEKYGKRVPGPEHREYVINNPDKVPRDLKDGNYIFFFREPMGAYNSIPVVQWEYFGDDPSGYWDKGKFKPLLIDGDDKSWDNTNVLLLEE
jgi:hypothetical protein